MFKRSTHQDQLISQEIVRKQTMLQKSTASPLIGFTDKPFTIFPPQLHSPVPACDVTIEIQLKVQKILMYVGIDRKRINILESET